MHNQDNIQPSYPSHLYGHGNPTLWGAIVQRLDYMISNHSRVMFIRLDLHFPNSIDIERPGDVFSRFMASFIKTLRIRRLNPNYVWSQEKNANASNPHFHIVLFIDSRTLQRPYSVIEHAKQLWNKWLGGNGSGCVHECRNQRDWGLPNGTIIDRGSSDYHEKYHAVAQWAAYLAKMHSSTGSIRHGRSFGCSQLPAGF